MSGKEKLERRSSKSRLSKQNEVDVHDDEAHDTSPSSETSDATIVAESEMSNHNSSDSSPDQTGGSEDVEVASESATESSSTQKNGGKELEKSNSFQQRAKLKLLVRGDAISDDSTPPPPDDITVAPATAAAVSVSSSIPNDVSMATATATATFAANSSGSLNGQRSSRQKVSRPRLDKSSSQSSSFEAGTSPCLSRESSTETQYTDFAGTDLEEFFRLTLNNKNPQDRRLMLKIEQDLISFVKDQRHQYLKFPALPGYQRMLVHRIAAFFGLDHNVDQKINPNVVIVNKTSITRLPDFKFREHILDHSSQEETPTRRILRREGGSFEEGNSPHRRSLADKKSKSYEEREEHYKKTKARIFNQSDSMSSQEAILDSPVSVRSSKEDWQTDPRPWSSTDSSGYGTDTSKEGHRLAVTKASSFSGVPTILSRGDGRGARMTQTDSVSSSNSSSLSSPISRPPPIPSSPPPGDADRPYSSQSTGGPGPPQVPQGQVCWVASTPDSIPPGATIIDPQTGAPYRNPDGSIYCHQPGQPLPPAIHSTHQPQAPVIQQPLHGALPHQFPPPGGVQGPPGNVVFHQPPSSLQRQYSGESGGDVAHTFSGLSLSSQSSGSLPEPPCGGGASNPPQQYVIAPPQHGGPVNNTGPFQVSYYQPPGSQPQYMYRMAYAAQGHQGSFEGQTQGQGHLGMVPPSSSQYSSQTYMPNYQIVGYSVAQSTSNEHLQQQTNYQHQQVVQSQGQGQGVQGQQYSETCCQGGFAQQFPPPPSAGGLNQGGYVQTVQTSMTAAAGSYNTSSTTNTSTPAMSYHSVGGMAGLYRPTTPPSQGMAPPGQTVGVGPGGVNPGSYIGYPPGTSPHGTQGHPRPPGPGQFVPFQTSPSQNIAVLRPAINIPAVQQGAVCGGPVGSFPHGTPSVTGQFKILSVEQGLKPAKPTELYLGGEKIGDSSSSPSLSGHSTPVQMGPPPPPQLIQQPFRPPPPGNGDGRMGGAQLQQVFRCPVPQMYAVRPRYPTMPGMSIQQQPPQQPSNSSQRVQQKAWAKQSSQDSASPSPNTSQDSSQDTSSR
ncbi:cAMP-regulated phosphoprotein 21 isoform X2 [Lingula anatina]|uniref:cAMP-regulated phosphoprotein 21 isoform X2 n=1 Tax=Lingula anatina TaxID=7574 RepID=A0A1S3H1B0_LINAN|nr:cAMP-regulated phosphoprotein 21 isoform X2 [Lingula anatina]|eukprot:XP_013378929.1 cAMP-regulated phosphoprotein 21 isoform X2 [Lingula anatina]